MSTREQVRALLREGHSPETAARVLHISPGLVFMIATGLPADGSDAPAPEELKARGVSPGSSQHLVGPAALSPTRKPFVMDWVRERAARELAGGS
jgi:hypothetical protein